MATTAKKKECGTSMLLTEVARKTGLLADMQQAFPDDWENVLSLGFYSAMSDNPQPEEYACWAAEHAHPGSDTLTREEIGELTQRLEGQMEDFFTRRASRHPDGSFWYRDAFPYRKALSVAEAAMKANVSLLSTQDTEELVCYRVRQGADPDPYGMERLIARLSGSSGCTVDLSLDPSIYRLAFVDQLVLDDEVFVLGLPFNAHCAREMMKEHDDMKTFPYAYNSEHDLYIYKKKIDWPELDYRTDDPLLPDEVATVNLFLYYDVAMARAEQGRIGKRVRRYRAAFEAGTQDNSPDADWREYFEERMGPDGLPVYIEKVRELRHKAERGGFFAILAQGVDDAVDALTTYRMRNITDRKADAMRRKVEAENFDSTQELNPGFLFDFLGLYFLFWMDHKVKSTKLMTSMTLSDVLKEMERMQSWEGADEQVHYSRPTKKQAFIFSEMGLEMGAGE